MKCRRRGGAGVFGVPLSGRTYFYVTARSLLPTRRYQLYDNRVSLAVKVRDRSEIEAPRWRLTLPELWAFVAIGLPVVASFAARLSTVDLAYQIRAGLQILATHVVPRVDTYTFTVRGHPWLDQQWGAQVLFGLAFRITGWIGLVIVRGALVGVTFALVYACCKRAGADRRLAAWLTIGAFAVGAPALNLRPQLFAITLFSLVAWIILKREKHPRWLWSVPAITLLWANLHGSFFLVLVLLGLAWLEDRATAPAAARRTIVIGAASGLATLANPVGVRVWVYVYEISTNAVITKYISEWQSPTIRNYAGAAFFISVAVVVVVLARRVPIARWTTLAALGAFFLIALQAQRGIIWWACIAPAILAGYLTNDAMRGSSHSERRTLNSAIAATVIVLGIVFAPWRHATEPLGGSNGILSFAPPGITKALGTVLKPGDRVFASQAWASWLEFQFRGTPEAIDSRIELFPPNVWQDYSNVANGRAGWQATLDRWGVDVVAVSRDQGLPLIPRIAGDPGWRQLYSDADGAVFVRRTSPAPTE
jgi:hypothetical protein